MSGEECGAIMPGTNEHDVDASVPEFRCLLPSGHDAHHATIIEWRDQWPWFRAGGRRLTPDKEAPMRKILAGLVVCVAALIPAATIAAPSLASQPHACSLAWNSNVNQQASPPYAQTWFHSFSGCASGYPIQYNRVDCQYPRVSGEFWTNGPTVHTGYSTVSCGAHPNGWIQDGYIWINAGSGWYDHHYYHFYPVI